MRKKFMQNGKNDFSAGRVFRTIVWIITVSICIPYLLAQQYAVFNADNFTYYLEHMQSPGNSVFTKGINNLANLYMTWQGTWVSELAWIFFNPMQFNSVELLRIILTGTLLTSIIGVFFLAHVVMDYYHIDRKNAIYFVGVFLVPLLSYRDYTDIYLWFVGMMVYLLPVLFFSIGFSFLLLGEMKQNKIFLFLSAIFLILMGGGVLEFVGFGMFWLLLFIIVEYIRTRKINRRYAVIFILSLISALANALAPGNFGRKQIIGGNLGIMNAVFFSIKAFVQDTVVLSRHTTFLVFVLLAFLLGCHIKKQISNSITAVSICGLILTPVITLFPVALGYDTDTISVSTLPIRCLFLLDAAVIACGTLSAFLIANKLCAKNMLPDIGKVRAAVCMAVLLVIALCGTKLINYKPVTISANLINGSIQEYERAWMDVFDQLENSDEANITVVGFPKRVAGCKSPGLYDDPTWWANALVAQYFGKESISIIEVEE